MPLYEYECSSCGHRFEKFQSIKARTPRQCPSCSERGTVRKRVSAPAFHLKGSGWYVTDYAKKGKEEVKEEGKEADKAPSESSSSDKTPKSDAKDKKDSGKSSSDKATKKAG